jgi:hypothetical protein
VGEALLSMLIRLSIPGTDAHGGPADEPTYGGQLQPKAIPNVEPEGNAFVSYEEIPGAFEDGEAYSLRRPTYTIDGLSRGSMAPEAMISPRVAPQMVGLGRGARGRCDRALRLEGQSAHARPASIEAAITAAPVPVTPEHITSLGTSAKGLPALEDLLFDPAGPLVALGGSDEVAKRRCSFARALGETLGKDATTLHQAWSPDGGAFVDQVARAGHGEQALRDGSGRRRPGRQSRHLDPARDQREEARRPLSVSTGSADPSVDLTQVRDSLLPMTWILPLCTESAPAISRGEPPSR